MQGVKLQAQSTALVLRMASQEPSHHSLGVTTSVQQGVAPDIPQSGTPMILCGTVKDVGQETLAVISILHHCSVRSYLTTPLMT